MTEICDQYANWISTNISDLTASTDMGNAVNWLSRNWIVAGKYINKQQPHPGLAYSEAIREMADRIGMGMPDIDWLMANWIMEPTKTPFGRILKKKVAKQMVKRWSFLTAEAREFIINESARICIESLNGEWHYKYIKLGITKTAQQVDSAEASTNAVRPSGPSGSPR